MANYSWSNLQNGQTIVFDPAVDRLYLGYLDPDDTTFTGLNSSTTLLRVREKSVTFNGLGVTQIVSAISGVSVFHNMETGGSHVLMVGDNSLGSNDDGPNFLSAGFDPALLIGLGGNDTLNGYYGYDVLDGGAGDDQLNGSKGYGLNFDTASYASASAGVTVSLAIGTAQNTVGAGVDTLSSIEDLHGSLFADLLTGNEGTNLLRGGAGDDTLDGGGGMDTADYGDAPGGVNVNLSLVGAQNTQNAGNDTLLNFENLRGSFHNDTLTGSGLDNVLEGRAGDDTLVGGAGDDTLRAGIGSDQLDGGPGNDTADYRSANLLALAIDLNAGNAILGNGPVKTVIGVENVLATEPLAKLRWRQLLRRSIRSRGAIFLAHEAGPAELLT